MVVGLLGLWARRIFVDRVRYISAPSDHLMLALLVAIAGTGLGMKYLAHTDVVAVKAFFLGLMRFDWQPLPSDLMLLAHLTLVLALMIVFPFSKLCMRRGYSLAQRVIKSIIPENGVILPIGRAILIDSAGDVTWPSLRRPKSGHF